MCCYHKEPNRHLAHEEHPKFTILVEWGVSDVSEHGVVS